jgi:hypothetical protein
MVGRVSPQAKGIFTSALRSRRGASSSPTRSAIS